jgi:hypothetical protein
MFPTLTCIGSLALQRTMIVTIRNQCSNIELISPVYFYNCDLYYEYPVVKADGGVVMKINFRFDLNQDEPRGILMYALQRKSNTRSNCQSSIDTEDIEETLKMMRLLIVWKIDRSGWPKTDIILVEYDNELVLNEDKLAQLYDKIFDIPPRPRIHNWLMCNTTLEAFKDILREEGLELNMMIYRRAKSIDTMQPLWIDSTRQVLSVMTIYTMLIYIVSLNPQSIMDVTIENCCSNVELTSPAHFIRDKTCHMQFPQKVNPKSKIRARFMTGVGRDTFGGVLLYHLQRKENISTSAQLLVIWGYEDARRYLDVHIIEHENTFDNDELKKLYDVYENRYETKSDLKAWLLNDNTIVKTLSQISQVDFEMKFFIYEGKYPFYRKPLRVSSQFLLEDGI